jgi:hypothetical protein
MPPTIPPGVPVLDGHERFLIGRLVPLRIDPEDAVVLPRLADAVEVDGVGHVGVRVVEGYLDVLALGRPDDRAGVSACGRRPATPRPAATRRDHPSRRPGGRGASR